MAREQRRLAAILACTLVFPATRVLAQESSAGPLPEAPGAQKIEMSERGEGPERREGSERARGGEIETDRDSFTPATTTAGRNRLIVESAYSFFDNRGVKETHSFPELVLRFGLGDRLEFRFG